MPQRMVIADMPVPSTLSAPANESRIYVVPKGHILLASPAVTQKDPKVWKDAETWDPYRWTDPSGIAAQALSSYNGEGEEKVDYGFGKVSKGTETTYQPFGSGRHRCIGETVRHSLLCSLRGKWSNNATFSLHISNSEPSSRH